MGEVSKASSGSPNSNPSSKPSSAGGRQRIISSCLTCRRRKVRCDHGHPICGACTRGNHVCTYATDQGLGQSPGRVAKTTFATNGKAIRGGTDVQSRLDRLELLLEKAVSSKPNVSADLKESIPIIERSDREKYLESQFSPAHSASSASGGVASDNHDGTLLLEEGQSQFVSSLHWALLADEIQDIKALLGDKTSEEDREMPTRNNLIHFISLGRARISVTLQELLPPPQYHQPMLELFLSNVDPMIRITHNPSLIRKFSYYISEAHSIAWAVFYAAVNSIPPAICKEKFGENKEELLIRLELGVEISLARENYLTTSSTEVLQGFVIWLTCITTEDDMGKAWCLIGTAIRIALNQGLHRDPSLFPPGSMDSVSIEVRRRLWHHISNLEYRAAETKGQEPSIKDDDFTTMLPRNIEDEDLVEGASPGPDPYNEERFTAMTFQLVRFLSMQSMRRIVQSTYRLERNMQEAGLRGASAPNPVQELQAIYTQVQTMLDELHDESQRKYLQYCNPEIPVQRLCLGLASLLEWRCYLLFWLRMPRAYRDTVFTTEMRVSIFEKSVSCIETVNGASVDVEAARFHWHIGGHSAFQAIMHILSELKNPLFDVPDRRRALRALQMCRLLKEENKTKAWTVIKSLIDKLLADELILNRGNSQSSSSSFASPAVRTLNNPSRTDVPLYVDRIPQYAYTRTAEPVSYTSPQQNQAAQAALAAPVQPVQQSETQNQPHTQPQNMQFNWDDISLSSIGAAANPQNLELPEFDWGFWGDPVNFTDAGNFNFPLDQDPFAPFNG